MRDQLLALTGCAPGAFDACNFDKTLTIASGAFVLAVFAAAAVLFYTKGKTPHFWRRFGLTALAVFIFELFTAPLWDNLHLGSFAYAYRDVSWVLTLGWATMITVGVAAVDDRWPKLSAARRFGRYLLLLAPIAIGFELLVRAIGVRGYAPEVFASVSGVFLPWRVPVEILYYIPVFLTLVISFTKYVALGAPGALVVPTRRSRWFARLGFATVGVFFFELLVEPMVNNVGFPSWSYVYRDITLFATGAWVLICWAATALVDRAVPQWPLLRKLGAYLVVASALMVPLEAYQITHGLRVYGESATKNFSGITTWGGVPVEVLFAVPCYLVLVICFARYWLLVTDRAIARENV